MNDASTAIIFELNETSPRTRRCLDTSTVFANDASNAFKNTNDASVPDNIPVISTVSPLLMTKSFQLSR